MNPNTRRWLMIGLLAVLLVALVVIINSCIKPDRTAEVNLTPTDPVMLPFPATTPPPTPGPTSGTGGEQGGLEGWTGQTSGVGVTTAAPTTIPPIQLVTATPSPVPTWTAPPTAKPTDDGTLRHGSTGQAVRQLQQKLKDLGYYTGTVDGDFGDGTESALRAFQSANGLSVDGVAGSRTLSTLNSGNAKAKPKATAKVTATPNSAYATSRPTPKSYTPSTPSVYKYLQLGSSGSDVKKLQQRLKDLGYFNGVVNGNFGEDTEAAVKAFQKRNGEWVDGVAGEDTQRTLYSSAALAYSSQSKSGGATATSAYRTLKNGMSGDDVKELQQRLKDLGYYSGSVDGKFGNSTETAVKQFQQFNGLTVDGVAGSGTQTKLFDSTAVYAPISQASPTPFKASGTLEIGSMGDDVYRLQERLYDLGYYNGRIDGIYSDAVALAVRAFQSANNLTADGKAGATTQTKIYSVGAVASKNADGSFATLRQGDSGDRVRALQNLLTTYGYFSNAIDGNYGDTTVMAVQQFQATNSLFIDGIAGPATLQLLYQGNPIPATVASGGQTLAFATLRQGMSSPDVLMMQQFLSESGYYHGALDGEYDAETFIAVQAFQQANSLTADGIAGQETLALLYSGESQAVEGGANIQYGVAGTSSAVSRTTMKKGDEGQDVFDLQARLAQLGYLAASPTGTFDTETASAVKDFQQRNGLSVDGEAGPATQEALYKVGVVPKTASAEPMGIVSNNARELEEQQAAGAIQGSLAGGGIAASYNNIVYYTGANGGLYKTSGGAGQEIYKSPASYIHASSKGITFVSDNKIMRVPIGGGAAQTLVQAGGIEKLSMLGETMYYLEGNTLVKAFISGDATEVATGVNDFCVDVYQYTAYVATDSGVKSIALIDGVTHRIASAKADQVQLCDSVLFFRSGGGIYRIDNGISKLLLEADASWMGIYRSKVYYISGDRLYRCDTDGQNNQVFYDGLTSKVSFVAGKVYVASGANGAVQEILSAD